MLVKDVMTKKVLTISPDWDFLKVIRFFFKNKVSGAPVVDKDGSMIGIISEKDLLHKLFPSEKEFYKNIDYYFGKAASDDEIKQICKTKAKKIMIRDVVSVKPDDNILTACAMLLLHNIRRLPVVEKGKIVGIVTTNNVFRNYLLTVSKGA